MENKCSKCKTIIPTDTKKPITCDICKAFFCKNCSQLSSSEVKVMELVQRKMIFSCTECTIKPTENLLSKEIKKCIEIINDKIKKNEEKYTQKMEHLLDIIEQREINSTTFVQQQIQDLKSSIELHITKLHDFTNKNKNEQLVKEQSQDLNNGSVSRKIITTKATVHKTSNSPMTATKAGEPSTSKNFFEIQQAQRELANKIINLGQINNSDSSNSLNDGKTLTPSLKKLPTDDKDDKFIQVTNKKKWRRRGNIGSGDDNQADTNNFEGSAVWKNKKHWVIIKKVKDNANTEKIKEYLKNKLSAEEEEDISVKWLETYHKVKDNNCYLIGFDIKYMNIIYDPKLWPKGVIFDRFDFQKGQRFLDNPKVKQNGIQRSADKNEDIVEDFHVT